MDKQQFEQWLEQHMGELLAVAKRLTNSEQDAQDAVQAAVVQALGNGKLTQVKAPWTWMVNAVRGTASNIRRGNERADAAKREVRRVLRAGLYQGRKRLAPRAE